MERHATPYYIVEWARSMNRDSQSSKASLIGKFLTDNKGFGWTSFELNRVAHTVDARKYITELRRRGVKIEGVWDEQDGRRFKLYYINL